MSDDSELLTDGSETSEDYLLNIPPESSSSGDPSENIRSRPEIIKELNAPLESTPSIDSFHENWLDPSIIRRIIRSELHQLPETRWVQNLQHSSYYLRQPIPILIEKADDVVTATYDDIELYSTGDSAKEATLNLCTKIVARYEELRKSDAQSRKYAFLKRIIEEVEPPAWQELKQLYRDKLEDLLYVKKGYIKIDGNNADVVIVLSEESVEIIEHLAGIDLEINLQFRPLYFFVEYESSEDYLELDDFERFY